MSLSEVERAENVILGKKKNKGIFYFLAAFFVPLIIILFSYAIQGVYPFGEKHILTVDLYHQYAPFLRELRDKILSGDSLFYTWTGGLGFNFYAVITYYLASPFNLLLLFFGNDQLSDAVLLITILKIASSSLSFYFFAYKKHKKHDLFQLALSFGYALSAYSIAYSWNIMWLDTIILLPLVVLGLIMLIEGKSVRLYILSLVLILIVNYYTAFFVCIFLFFYYFVISVDIENKNKFKNNKNKLNRKKWLTFGKFAGSSLFAAMLAAITLLPTIYALLDTSATGDTFPEKFEFFEPFIDFTSRLLIPANLSIRDGMPNLYMGVIILLLLPFFFLNKRISSKRKIAYGSLLVVLIFSLNNNVLNFIWHGFHYPNQLPYRNSFVLVFFLCQIALTSYHEWKIYKLPKNPVEEENLDIAFPKVVQEKNQNSVWFRFLGVWAILLLLLQKIDPDIYTAEMIVASLILLFIYTLVLNSAKDKNVNKRFIGILLFFVMTMELSMNSIIGINSITENEYYGNREGYKAGEYPNSIHERVEQIKDLNINSRASLWPDKSVNDPMLYGYPGLTVFASTYREEPVQFFSKLGYDNNGINSYQNTGSNIIVDSLLGLEYKITSPTRDEQTSFYNLIDEDDQTKLYKNLYALPLLYEVPSTAINFSLDENKTAFENQKKWINLLSGNEEMLQIIDPELTLGLGNQIEHLGNNEYSISKEEGFNGERYFSFEISPEVAGYHTLSWQSTSLKFSRVEYELIENQNLEIENNNNPTDLDDINSDHSSTLQETTNEIVQLSNKDNSLSDLGYLDKSQKIKVTFTLSDDSSNNGNLTLEAARIDDELFEGFIKELKINSVNPKYIKSNYLMAEISMPNDGYLLFTTTFDPGWNISINGDEVEYESFDDALVLIPVKAGINEIEMKFIPKGFTVGAIISSISILAGFLTILYKKNKIKKEKSSLPNLVKQSANSQYDIL
ncbi:MAG: YfhO family protein [Clostridiaceae bacterium]|nr:YfhO family protein [Clostridiaceae bacterium]